MELHLVLLSELAVHRSESGLFSRELLVEVADVTGRFLDIKVKARVFWVQWLKKIRTIWGKYGGGILLLKTSSQLTSLKKGCCLISSASPLPEPNRRVGSLVSSCVVGHYNVGDVQGPLYLLQNRNGVLRHSDRV